MRTVHKVTNRNTSSRLLPLTLSSPFCFYHPVSSPSFPPLFSLSPSLHSLSSMFPPSFFLSLSIPLHFYSTYFPSNLLTLSSSTSSFPLFASETLHSHFPSTSPSLIAFTLSELSSPLPSTLFPLLPFLRLPVPPPPLSCQVAQVVQVPPTRLIKSASPRVTSFPALRCSDPRHSIRFGVVQRWLSFPCIRLKNRPRFVPLLGLGVFEGGRAEGRGEGRGRRLVFKSFL